jgi:hypothetical protein
VRNTRASGFQALPEQDRAAIFNFTFLWSLFEAQVMERFARADMIRAKVGEWHAVDTLDAEQYSAYFRQRYFVNGAFTHHFPHLRLRPADQPYLVRSVLDGSNNDPRDRLLTVLMIVWRFRNNLFDVAVGRVAGTPGYFCRGLARDLQGRNEAADRPILIIDVQGQIGFRHPNTPDLDRS